MENKIIHHFVKKKRRKLFLEYAKEMEENMKRSLTCSIDQEIFRNPTLLTCGHTFCLTCVKKLIEIAKEKGQNTFPCPLCKHNNNVQEEEFKPNHLAKSQVETLTLRCRNTGCNQLLKGCEWEKHEEEECDYRRCKCKNRANGCLFESAYKDIHPHLMEDCEHYACKYQKYGCSFLGRKDSIIQHCQNNECIYHKLRGFLKGTYEKQCREIADLKYKLNQQSEQLGLLENRVRNEITGNNNNHYDNHYDDDETINYSSNNNNDTSDEEDTNSD